MKYPRYSGFSLEFRDELLRKACGTETLGRPTAGAARDWKKFEGGYLPAAASRNKVVSVFGCKPDRATRDPVLQELQ
jgi:hypothetical protein